MIFRGGGSSLGVIIGVIIGVTGKDFTNCILYLILALCCVYNIHILYYENVADLIGLKFTNEVQSSEICTVMCFTVKA